jgi:hypothetical protein
MQRMTTADVWKAAPPTIRQQHDPGKTSVDTNANSTPAGNNLFKLGSEENGQDETSTVGGSHSIASSRNTGNPRRPSLDVTTGTTNSPLTRATIHGNITLGSNISELEASFERHQAEIQKIHERMTFMDESAKRAI